MSRVSIIIPCHNQGNFLPDALTSCANQTHTDLEIIIINDGSSPTETTLIEAAILCSGLPIIYLTQAASGVSHARNVGWRKATGDFIQFLDADDVLLPTKIERSLQQFQTLPENVGVIYTDFEIRRMDLMASAESQRPSWQMPEGAILVDLLNQVSTFFTIHCALIRRSWLEHIGGFNERLQTAEDWYLWASLASHGALFCYLDAPLVWYRDNLQGTSKKQLDMAIGRLHAVEDLTRLPISAGTINMERTLAARHHVLALRLWDVGQTNEARNHLMQAIQLDHEGRIGRAMLWSLSYLFKSDLVEKMIRAVGTLMRRTEAER